MFTYLSDILIYSKSISDHGHQVFQSLLENCLYIKAEKCEIHKLSITFLGYILEGRQVRAS